MDINQATFIGVLFLILAVLALFSRIEALRIARKLPDNDATWLEYAQGCWIVLRTIFHFWTAPLGWIILYLRRLKGR